FRNDLLVALQQKSPKPVGSVVGAFKRGVILVIRHPGIVIHFIVTTEQYRDGAGFLNLGLLLFRDFVFRRHAYFHRLSLAQRVATREERDPKHVHVHHWGIVYSVVHCLLLTGLLFAASFLFYFSHIFCY